MPRKKVKQGKVKARRERCLASLLVLFHLCRGQILALSPPFPPPAPTPAFPSTPRPGLEAIDLHHHFPHRPPRLQRLHGRGQLLELVGGADVRRVPWVPAPEDGMDGFGGCWAEVGRRQRSGRSGSIVESSPIQHHRSYGYDRMNPGTFHRRRVAFIPAHPAYPYRSMASSSSFNSATLSVSQMRLKPSTYPSIHPYAS